MDGRMDRWGDLESGAPAARAQAIQKGRMKRKGLAEELHNVTEFSLQRSGTLGPMHMLSLCFCSAENSHNGREAVH